MRVGCEIGWVSNQIDGRNYYEKERELEVKKKRATLYSAQGCLKSDVALSKSPRLPNLFHKFSLFTVQASCSPSGIYTTRSVATTRLFGSKARLQINPIDRFCLRDFPGKTWTRRESVSLAD